MNYLCHCHLMKGGMHKIGIKNEDQLSYKLCLLTRFPNRNRKKETHCTIFPGLRLLILQILSIYLFIFFIYFTVALLYKEMLTIFCELFNVMGFVSY